MKNFQILILLFSCIYSLQASENRIKASKKEMLLNAFTHKASIKPSLSTIPEEESETAFQRIDHSMDQEMHIHHHNQTLIKPIVVNRARTEAHTYKFNGDNPVEFIHANKENACKYAHNQLQIQQHELNLPSRRAFQSLLNKVQYY